jgi:hypothetical protein
MTPKSYTFSVFELIALLLLRLAQSAPAAEVLYEDKFINLDPGWGAPSEILGVKDGKLTLKPALNTTQSVLNQSNVFHDADISVDVTISGEYKCTRQPRCTWWVNLLGERLRQFLLLMHRWHRFFQDKPICG